MAYPYQAASNSQQSQQQRIYEQRVANQMAVRGNGTMHTAGSPTVKHEVQHQQMMHPKTENEIEVHHLAAYSGSNSNSQLPADTKYGNLTNAIERCSISRARSNDQLLETTDGRSPYARKDLPLKQKSKSFESLENNQNEDEVSVLNVRRCHFSLLYAKTRISNNSW